MNTSTKPWMLYGANGFTGALIAREAQKREMAVVLAGRSEEKIIPLAKELNFPYEIFSLESVETIKEKIGQCSLVLLCAGPFSKTSENMVQACLELGIHYLDITGEIAVLERVLSLDSQAKKSGSVLIPGVGFDVVPSDCLAKILSEKLPEAQELNLAFTGEATLSAGTSKTMLENIPMGSKIRKNGKIISVPLFSIFKNIPILSNKPLSCSTIPWGDVASAFYSTHIPNIAVYGPAFQWTRWLKTPMQLLSPVLAHNCVQNLFKRQIEKKVKGPSEEEQMTSKMYLWGQVRKGRETIHGRLVVPEGYRFTMLTALRSVEKVLSGGIKPGSYTPSMAFGGQFIKEFPEVYLKLGDS
ncbi:MAG: hypothetical protein EBR01_10340 [Proteobacteria bacterium]|nr:hypothetical protein [Pseudomonadota bacterium]